jgi:hypothetical protein
LNAWKKFEMKELVGELVGLTKENEESHPDLLQGKACSKQFQMMRGDLQHRSSVVV